MSQPEFMFTSESVTEGHPDKIADLISDAAHTGHAARITTSLGSGPTRQPRLPTPPGWASRSLLRCWHEVRQGWRRGARGGRTRVWRQR